MNILKSIVSITIYSNHILLVTDKYFLYLISLLLLYFMVHIFQGNNFFVNYLIAAKFHLRFDTDGVYQK